MLALVLSAVAITHELTGNMIFAVGVAALIGAICIGGFRLADRRIALHGCFKPDLDSLSDLPNRRALHRDFAASSSGSNEVAMALIDLDSFKQVNDHFGHFVGDELIRRCAEVSKDKCGSEANCYRLGGDEFAILMSGIASGTIVEGICRKIISTLEKPVTISSREVVVGASIGLRIVRQFFAGWRRV